MDLKTTGFVWDEDKIYHRESQDVEPILKHAKFLRDSRIYGDPECQHVAKVPVVVHEQFRVKWGLSSYEMTRPEIIARLLNSDEVKEYRIKQGRV